MDVVVAQLDGALYLFAYLIYILVIPVCIALVVLFVRGVWTWRDKSKRGLNIFRIGVPITILGLVLAARYQAANPNRAEVGQFRDALSLSVAPDAMFDDLHVVNARCDEVWSGASPFTTDEDRWESWGGLDLLDIADADSQAFDDAGWSVQRYVERHPDNWPVWRSEFRAAQGFGFIAKNDELAITFWNSIYRSQTLVVPDCRFEDRFVSDFWEPVDQFPVIETVKTPWDAEVQERETKALRALLPGVPIESVEQVNARAFVAGQSSYCSTSMFFSGRLASADSAAEAMDLAVAALTDAGWSVATGISAFVASLNDEFITGVLDGDGLFMRRYPEGCTPIPPSR